jgi:ankyrin repeat protein
MQSRPPLQQQPEFSPLLNASTLANVASYLKPEEIVNLRLVNQGLSSAAFIENHDWRAETKRHFRDDYKKFRNWPNVNWFSLFKHLYDRHYRDLPARTVKICSSVCSGDVSALKQLNLVYDDLFLSLDQRGVLWELIASTRNQPLMDYFFQALVMPRYVPGIDDETRYRLLGLAAAFNQGAFIGEMSSFVRSMIHPAAIHRHDLTSPLHLAAQYGHVDVIRRLVLDCGVNVNFVPQYYFGGMPLKSAVRSGRVDAVEALFNLGANKENAGDLLHLAAQSGHYRTFKAIEKTGVSFSILCDGSSTLLHSAVHGRNIKIVNAVFEKMKNVEVDAVDQLGQTPLHLAAKYGCVDIFHQLLLSGASISIITKNGGSVLHYAAEGREPAIVKHIINKNIFDINMQDSSGETPLHRVFRGEYQFNHEVIDILIAARADVNAGKKTPLHCAVSAGDDVGVEKLLMAGATVNAVLASGETPIFGVLSEIKNHTRETMMNRLVDARADINIKINIESDDYDSLEDTHATLLHLAVVFNELPIVEMLLKAKADVGAVDQQGRTPLHLAVSNNKTEIVAALLEAGSPVDGVDECGRTPVAQQTIGQMSVSSRGLFSAPAEASEKRPSDGCDSPSKRQKK